MTIPQTAYPFTQERGFEGMLYGLVKDGQSTRTLTDPNNAIAFGRAIVQGTEDDEGKVVDATGLVVLGVSQHTHAIEPSQVPNAGDAVPANHPFNVLQQGRIWVVVESAVTAGGDVYVRFQNAGADPESNGRFRGDDDGASGDVYQLTSGFRWFTSAAAGELAVLEVNLPA